MLEAVTVRIFNIFYHPEVIYRQTKLYEEQCKAASNCAMIFGEEVLKNIRKKMAEDENNNNNSNPFSLIRALINPKYNLHDEEILDEVKSLVIAAQDTSAIGASSTLVLLAMHKNYQQKVVDELQNVFGKVSEVPFMDFETINQLEYLEMVINEAMRLFSVVPFIFRATSDDIKVGDHFVPKGANIIVPITYIHRNKKLWGEDAHLYRPERFEKENFEKMHPYAFIPFASKYFLPHQMSLCNTIYFTFYRRAAHVYWISLRYELDENSTC